MARNNENSNDASNKNLVIKKPANTWKENKDPAQRDKVLCNISEICGTCQFIDNPYQYGLDAKFKKGVQSLKDADLLKGVHVESPVPSPKKLGYRTHAKLAVRKANELTVVEEGEPNRFGIGLFKPGSHELVNIGRCPLHKHTINSFVEELQYELNFSHLAPYDEVTHEGDIRYLSIRASHKTDELMVTYVVLNEDCKEDLKSLTTKLKNRGHRIRSAHININNEKTNAIFDNSSKRILGLDRLRERVCDLDFEIGPTSFFQVNPWQAENIYRRIESLAGKKNVRKTALDLYCGIGQISLILARCGFQVFGIEENPQAVRDAQKNATINMIKNPPNFLSGRVENCFEEIPKWTEEPDLIVVNPSRRGLQPSVCELLQDLLQKNPDCRLIYVSCEISSLVRDLKLIVTDNIRLKQIEAFDMFPYTDKMEWLAIL